MPTRLATSGLCAAASKSRCWAGVQGIQDAEKNPDTKAGDWEGATLEEIVGDGLQLEGITENAYALSLFHCQGISPFNSMT